MKLKQTNMTRLMNRYTGVGKAGKIMNRLLKSGKVTAGDADKIGASEAYLRNAISRLRKSNIDIETTNLKNGRVAYLLK